ncbi:hypothetical protein GGR50DRAFT_207943 [Xylaria sp. CBS 124048]|nr:hypothetical protein GGR50DRAFT_207943 [Xylaria sp. CBS 124048]
MERERERERERNRQKEKETFAVHNPFAHASVCLVCLVYLVYLVTGLRRIWAPARLATATTTTTTTMTTTVTLQKTMTPLGGLIGSVYSTLVILSI